jgi:LexA DNA binding domain
MNRVAGDSRPDFTQRQGQYLAFIHADTLVNGRPPAEADMQRFFRVTPPSVHQMVITLEQAGLISRQPGVARSIVVLVDRSALPELNSANDQPVKINVQRYSDILAPFRSNERDREADGQTGSWTVTSQLGELAHFKLIFKIRIRVGSPFYWQQAYLFWSRNA